MSEKLGVPVEDRMKGLEALYRVAGQDRYGLSSKGPFYIMVDALVQDERANNSWRDRLTPAMSAVGSVIASPEAWSLISPFINKTKPEWVRWQEKQKGKKQ